MKLRQWLIFSLLMGMAVMASAANQVAQVVPLMSKITAALKANRAADALPYFAELEGMEDSLSYPLPESFYYYYIDTLDKAGDKANAIIRGKIYLKKFGKDGRHYSQVSEIMNRLQSELSLISSNIIGLWDAYYNSSKNDNPQKIWIDDSGTLRIQRVDRSSGSVLDEMTNVRIARNRLLFHNSDADGEQYDFDLMLVTPSTLQGTVKSNRRGVAKYEYRRIK